jgi:hypothetical protein
MRTLSLQQQHQSLPDLFMRLLRRWVAVPADQMLEAARLGSDKLEYLTHHPESSQSDLGATAGGGADDLLRRRMLALELDPHELALSDPALVRHLQRRCLLCENRKGCAWDLARGSAGRAWQGQDDWCDYCENALALEMLIALRTRSQAAPKCQFPYIP